MAADQDLSQPAQPGKPRSDKTEERDPRGRAAIFAYDLAVVAVLILVGATYVWYPAFPKPSNDKYLLAIQSMWFGALGGVIISLKGIYDHSVGADGWDSSFNLWHIGRPVSGAVAGLMTVVLLLVVNASGDLSAAVVFAAAFIFGTQERRFFNFLYEVARLVVQVPEETKGTGLRITSIEPSQGSFGGIIVISGQGIEPNASVKLGGAAIEDLTVAPDGMSAAGLIPRFPAGTAAVDVVVVNPSGASFVLSNKFKYTA
jgi:hypothetical protein